MRDTRTLSPSKAVVLDTHGSLIKLVLAIVALIAGTLLSFNIMIALYPDIANAMWEWFPSVLLIGVPQAIICLIVLVLDFVLYFRLTCLREIVRWYDLEGIISLPKIFFSHMGKGPKMGSSTMGLCDINEMLYHSHESESEEGGTPNGQLSDYALASLFLTACITPKEVYKCIDERIRADERTIGVESYVTFNIPSYSQASSFVIPAFFHRRGDYPDSLNIQESTLGETTFLNLNETMEYAMAVIETSLPELNKCQQAIDLIRTFINDRKSMTAATVKSRKKDLDRIIATLESFGNQISGANRRNYLNRCKIIARFLETQIEAYPICLRYSIGALSAESANCSRTRKDTLRHQVLHTRAVTIAISYKLPLVHTAGRWTRGKKRPFRSVIATVTKKPNTIYYGIGNADRTQSYHLQIDSDEGTYCSFAALRRIEGYTTDGQDEETSPFSEEIGYPEAEMAYAQKRFGQRLFSLCIRNGQGFSNWVIMFRHTPRFFSVFHLSLISSLIAAAMAWVYLVLAYLTSDRPNFFPDGALVAALLTGVGSIALTRITRTNRSARGQHLGPLAASLLVAFTVVVTILSFGENSALYAQMEAFIVVSCAMLVASVLILLARSFAWFYVAWVFRRESVPSIDLICEDGHCQEERSAALNWSPGWLGVDYNRFIDFRYSSNRERESRLDYESNRDYIRDTFVVFAKKGEPTAKKKSTMRYRLKRLPIFGHHDCSNATL